MKKDRTVSVTVSCFDRHCARQKGGMPCFFLSIPFVETQTMMPHFACDLFIESNLKVETFDGAIVPLRCKECLDAELNTQETKVGDGDF